LSRNYIMILVTNIIIRFKLLNSKNKKKLL
jgi:hypothetical protein